MDGELSRGERKPMYDDFHVWIPVDVRWGDMDAYGHVNNACYFTYCESARIRYFEAIDLEASRAGQRSPADDEGPAVVTAACHFRQQVHYPAALEVGVRASKIGRSSFDLEYVIRYRVDDPQGRGGQVAADGSSVVVWVDYGKGKSAPLPERLKERIRDLDGL